MKTKKIITLEQLIEQNYQPTDNPLIYTNYNTKITLQKINQEQYKITKTEEIPREYTAYEQSQQYDEKLTKTHSS